MKRLRDPRTLPEQLAADISDRIAAGEWPAGGQLPSEQRIAELAGVSRPTVRAALQMLAGRGVVDVRHGAGTFVRVQAPSLRAGLQELRSMTDLIAEQRPDAQVRYRRRERRTATAAECETFDATEPLEVIAIERCFVAGGQPVAYESSLLNATLIGTALDPEALTGSVFAALEPLGLVPERATASVRAVRDPGVAWPDAPSPSEIYLLLSQRSFLVDGRVITASTTHFVEDAIDFTLLRRR